MSGIYVFATVVTATNFVMTSETPTDRDFQQYNDIDEIRGCREVRELSIETLTFKGWCPSSESFWFHSPQRAMRKIKHCKTFGNEQDKKAKGMQPIFTRINKAFVSSEWLVTSHGLPQGDRYLPYWCKIKQTDMVVIDEPVDGASATSCTPRSPIDGDLGEGCSYASVVQGRDRKSTRPLHSPPVEELDSPRVTIMIIICHLEFTAGWKRLPALSTSYCIPLLDIFHHF